MSFHIHHIQLAGRTILPFAENIYDFGDYLGVTPGKDRGQILCPGVFPRLLERWEGFEILPSERGITVAIAGYEANDPYREFYQGEWVESPVPIYYTPDEMRSHICSWQGGARFLLSLDGRVDARVTEIKIGAYTVGNLLSYLMLFALPKLLSVPVTLMRQVKPSSDGLKVTVPPGFKPEKISNVKVLTVPDHKTVRGSVIPSPGTSGITLEEPIPVQTAFLTFDYKPGISSYDSQEIEQITEIPSVSVRVAEAKNPRQVRGEDWVRVDTDNSKIWCAVFQQDIEIEIKAIGATLADTREIAEAIASKLGRGFVALPAYGINVGIRILGYIKEFPTFPGEDGVRRGDTNTLAIRAELFNVPRQIETRSTQIIQTISVEGIGMVLDLVPDAIASNALYLSVSYPTAIYTSALRLMRVNAEDKLVFADRLLSGSVLGLSKSSGVPGETIEIITEGHFHDSSWNWNVEMPLYLGRDGQIVQSISPEEGGWIVQIGIPVTSDEININILESVKVIL